MNIPEPDYESITWMVWAFLALGLLFIGSCITASNTLTKHRKIGRAFTSLAIATAIGFIAMVPLSSVGQGRALQQADDQFAAHLTSQYGAASRSSLREIMSGTAGNHTAEAIFVLDGHLFDTQITRTDGLLTFTIDGQPLAKKASP